MQEHMLLGLSLIVVLGVTAHWLAWRLRVPSILILLTVGFIAGPVTGVVNPDQLLGPLLFPVVSLAVGVIMFEGALGLRFAEIRSVSSVIRNLISIGMLTTWFLSALAAQVILQLSWPLALLLGAILVVTGPTVVIPLLRHVRPQGSTGAILRWEGILIDPIGATLGLLVFEFILASSPREATTGVALNLARTLAVGGAVGLLGAGTLYELLKRYWVPDYLQNSVALMTVVGVFALSDAIQHESGLLTVTVMGVALANQRKVPIRQIVEFKENVGVLLLSILFILLSARIGLPALALLSERTLIFIAVLMVFIRPASVALSTFRSPLRLQERMFLAWTAPRGIVAASVTSIFALGLAEAGHVDAERLVPVMFAVIVMTVAIYGLTARPLAQLLGIASRTKPQGILLVGAHKWARAMARELNAAGFPTILVDTNNSNIEAARADGLTAHHGSVLAEDVVDDIDLTDVGRLVAVTSNDEVNALATLHFREILGRAEVYQLAIVNKAPKGDSDVPTYLRGRVLWAPTATYQHLTEQYVSGAEVRSISVTHKSDLESYLQTARVTGTPFFQITEGGKKLVVVTRETPVTVVPGDTIIGMFSRQPSTRLDTLNPTIDTLHTSGSEQSIQLRLQEGDVLGGSETRYLQKRSLRSDRITSARDRNSEARGTV